MIIVIDYDVGNLRSVGKALFSLGEVSIIARDGKTIPKADKVILPGVGSFGDAMGKLKQYDLAGVICETANQGAPFLGICLELWLLFADSEESQGAAGLGVLPGRIPKTPKHPGLKVPRVGRNSLKIRSEARLFRGIGDGTYVYLVHSYCLKAEDESVAAASTEYSTITRTSIKRGNVSVCQFHPEKSGKVGLIILKNFIGL